MGVGSIIALICFILAADTGVGALVLIVFSDDYIDIPVQNPVKLYKSTKMNWFGCIFIYIFMHLLFFPLYLIFDLNLLFHIGRN